MSERTPPLHTDHRLSAPLTAVAGQCLLFDIADHPALHLRNVVTPAIARD